MHLHRMKAWQLGPLHARVCGVGPCHSVVSTLASCKGLATVIDETAISVCSWPCMVSLALPQEGQLLNIMHSFAHSYGMRHSMHVHSMQLPGKEMGAQVSG